MKKQVRVLILTIVLILISTLVVNAADATARLRLSSEEVKKGDTFTVTLNVACEEGINGLQGSLDYDQNKLELVSLEVLNTTKWINLGEGKTIEILHNSTDKETSTDIIKATFKVKDTVEPGTKAKISVLNIILDSDASENSAKEIGTKEIEVSIVEKVLNNDQEDNITDTDNKENVEDNKSDVDDKKDSGNNLKEDTTKEQINLKDDNTKANSKLPKTGAYSVIGIVALMSISAIIFYNKYNKYKQI